MTIPDIDLDDRKFQDLVDEARTRLRANCPEWTEHNVSDPGITLIESFAWMTEQLIFRLNQVPDKLHVALLNLLGIERAPASAARADVRFMLVDAAELPVTIPAHVTEITTPDAKAVFRVEDDFVVRHAPMVDFVRMAQELVPPVRPVPVNDGAARPTGADVLAFSPTPRPGDALHLGFDVPLSRLIMRVEVEATRAAGEGIKPDDPPLEWWVSSGDGTWEPVDVIEDTTGGFNRGTGFVELQMPPVTARNVVGGRSLHWLRCSVSERTRTQRAADPYTRTPRLSYVAARPVGALVVTVNATRQHEELLGTSEDTPGQTFSVRQESALALGAEGDGLLVRETPEGGFEAWKRVDGFEKSGPNDRHYRFDAAAGEVRLGPAIRQPDGRWRQQGRRPPAGAELRLSYWYGGGKQGHVPAGALKVLRTGIPGVESVVNPAEATGGADPESLDMARARAPMQMQARDRAVTRQDFQFLAEEVGDVARAYCATTAPGEPIVVYVLAKVPSTDLRATLGEFTPSAAILGEVTQHLNERRLVGSRVVVMPAPLVGVTVVADVRPTLYASAADVQLRVEEALNTFIHPLTGGSTHGPSSAGWSFGQAVTEADVWTVIERVPGVEMVRSARIFKTKLRDDGSEDKPAQHHVVTRLKLEPHELPASSKHRVRVDERAAR